MEFYYHYQEKTKAGNVSNSIFTIAELCDFYNDEFIVEHILNHVGEWVDIGIDENDDDVLVRVKYIVSKGNLNTYIYKPTIGAGE